MSKRDLRLYLADILDAATAIEGYIAGLSSDAFAKDRKTVDAVVRNLEVIGEAAGKLDEPARMAMPEIDWRKIVAMRNILANEYFGISKPIIWDVSKNLLPVLVDVCRKYASELTDSSRVSSK